MQKLLVYQSHYFRIVYATKVEKYLSNTRSFVACLFLFRNHWRRSPSHVVVTVCYVGREAPEWELVAG